MKLLLILPYIPYPLDSGGNQAVFTMIEALSKEHALTIVFRGEENENTQKLKELLPQVSFKFFPWSQHGEDTPYESFGYKQAGFRRIHYFASSFRRKYYRFLNKHKNDNLSSPQNERRHAHYMTTPDTLGRDHNFYQYIGELAKEGFDAVQCEFYETLPLVYYLPQEVSKIFVHHELAFVRTNNEIELFPDKDMKDRVFAEIMKDKEIAMLKRFDHIIALTQTDKEILEKELPGKSIFASPAIIHTQEFCPFKACSADLVFVGNATHYPNLDGLVWFCKEVMPELRKYRTDCKIWVTGQWDKKVKKQLLKWAPELEFVGFVPDLSALLNGKISIIPIRIGSGMRMKVLESIQAMSPMVITSKGIEGQDFQTEENCLIADSAESFAQAINRLISDAALQEKLSEGAKEKIKNTYNHAEMLEKRLTIYRTINTR